MSFGIDVKSSNFDELIENKDMLIVDFWAPWCTNCPQIEKLLEDTQKKVGDDISFANSNVEEDGVLASKFGVRSLPSVLIFKNGQVMSQLSGTFSEDQLMDKIKEIKG